jgi:hypothetical protein
MTSSLPNFPAAPAPASPAPAHAASNADFDVTSSDPTGEFADLMSDADAATEVAVTASAMPGFTILAPTLISLLGTAESGEVDGVPATEATDEVAPASVGISRDQMEQAASFLATILQSVLPEQTPPAVASGLAAEGCSPISTSAIGVGVETDAHLQNALGVPGEMPVETASSAAAESAATSYNFEATLAADGAVEINATLPSPKEQGSTEKASASRASAPSDGVMEIQAELALPGQAVIRLSASGSPDDALRGRANFAGKNSTGKITPHSLEAASERNFLVAGEKELKNGSALAGITVAKTESTMNSAPTESTRATSSSDTPLGLLPARGEFTVAWPSAERTGEAAVAPLENDFAGRAVATVTNLVDTQFTASMQKSGSVQLRLKFGGEDLNVRVELRGGEVHTDFRTDSPELRAALNREWQAVAGQSSESLRRFVEPVFSPSSSNGGDSSHGFARQQAASQDLSQQQRSPRAREEDAMTFTRRSLVGETFSPQPAAPRAPALVPTSLRLSVLA